MDACYECEKPTKPEKRIVCSGCCGHIFHQSCVLDKAHIASWDANVGLVWFCATCRLNFDPAVYDQQQVIMKALRELLIRMDSMDTRLGCYGENLRRINKTLYESGPSAKTPAEAVERSRSCEETSFFEIIDEINSTIAQAPERFQLNSRKRVQINPRATSSTIKPAKPKDVPSSSPKVPAVSSDLNNVVVASRLKVAAKEQPPEDETAFYVTPFDPDQDEEDIKLHVCEVANCEVREVKVSKLVPRGRNFKDLTFVSFKVTVPNTVADTVGNNFYWPDGIRVRPFESISKNEPQRMPARASQSSQSSNDQ